MMCGFMNRGRLLLFCNWKLIGVVSELEGVGEMIKMKGVKEVVRGCYMVLCCDE